MAQDLMPDELGNLKELENALISKRILFKKVATMYRESEFSKIKGRICNISIGTENLWNILPIQAVSNRLINVSLQWNLQYRGYVYFEPVCPHIICQVLAYLGTS